MLAAVRAIRLHDRHCHKLAKATARVKGGSYKRFDRVPIAPSKGIEVIVYEIYILIDVLKFSLIVLQNTYFICEVCSTP